MSFKTYILRRLKAIGAEEAHYLRDAALSAARKASQLAIDDLIRDYQEKEGKLQGQHSAHAETLNREISNLKADLAEKAIELKNEKLLSESSENQLAACRRLLNKKPVLEIQPIFNPKHGKNDKMRFRITSNGKTVFTSSVRYALTSIQNIGKDLSANYIIPDYKRDIKQESK